MDIINVEYKGRQLRTIRVCENGMYIYGFYLDAKGEPLLLYFSPTNKSQAIMADMHLVKGNYMCLISAINSCSKEMLKDTMVQQFVNFINKIPSLKGELSISLGQRPFGATTQYLSCISPLASK